MTQLPDEAWLEYTIYGDQADAGETRTVRCHHWHARERPGPGRCASAGPAA
jgi:hypothetical protein